MIRFTLPLWAWLGLLPLIAHAGVTVGSPDNPGALPAQIYEAYQKGARDITIQPGAYALSTMNTGDTILLKDWNDAVVHAPNVTLIFQDERWEHRPLHLLRCRNVKWEGGILSFPTPSFTQGRIMASHLEDDGAISYDWKIDAGYSRNPVIFPDLSKGTFNTIDPSTRRMKVATGDWRPIRYEKLQDDLFRLYDVKGAKPGFAVGDWLVTRSAGGGSLAQLDQCDHCTLDDVTFHNGGFATMFDTEGKGGNHYLNCTIEPGPRPPDATVDEMVSCGADGLHSDGTMQGPDIEDCKFFGNFLDDCIAIHGMFSQVLRVQGRTVLLANAKGRPEVGEPLRITNPAGVFIQAVVQKISYPNNQVEVVLDRDVSIPQAQIETSDPAAGTKASNPARSGQGYIVKRCTLGNTRGRGILAKADNGLIQDCTIENSAMSGVSLGPEFSWDEANYCWNIQVIHNVLRYCARDNGDEGSVFVHGDGAIGNRNIKIQDNFFDRCYGKYIIRAEFTDQLEIVDNKIDRPFSLALPQPGNILWLHDVRNPQLGGNQVTRPGMDFGSLVDSDEKGDFSALLSGISVGSSHP